MPDQRIKRVLIGRPLPDSLREVERMMNQMMGPIGPLPGASYFVPSADVYETDQTVVVIVELAGVKRSDIEVRFESNTLTITGRRPDLVPSGEPTLRLHQLEIDAGRFRKSVQVNLPIQVAEIEATMTDGLLRVTLPKVPRDQPTGRLIEIR